MSGFIQTNVNLSDASARARARALELFHELGAPTAGTRAGHADFYEGFHAALDAAEDAKAPMDELAAIETILTLAMLRYAMVDAHGWSEEKKGESTFTRLLKDKEDMKPKSGGQW